MTLTEASTRAAALGLLAVERDGWCYLLPPTFGPCVVRGGTWAEAFALLAIQQAPPMPGVSAALSGSFGLFDWMDP